MSFSEILGGGETARQLDTLANNGRLPHAVIFESRDEALCERAAGEAAAAFLCEGSGKKPCGVCAACRKVRAGVHPDVYNVVTTNGKQATGVGEIREMIADCYIKPNEGRGKVYLIFDKMTAEAQNALLKILEEPPQSVQFVIATASSTLLLKTVLSRCALFKLITMGEKSSAEAFDIAVEIARAVSQNIELPLLGATSRIIKSRELASQTLDILEEFFTMALEEKYLGEGGYADYITGMSRMLRRDSVVKLLDVVAQAREMLSHNCNMNILATWLCANIRESRH